MAVGGIEPLAALEDEALERRLRGGRHRRPAARRRAGQHGAAAARPRAARARRRPRAGPLAAAPHATARRSSPLERLVAVQARTGVRDPAREGVRAHDRPDPRPRPDPARRGGRGRGARRRRRVRTTAPPSWPGARRGRRAGGRAAAEHGPARGKGDAMWRGLAATSGDIVVYIDADSSDVDASFARGAIGPLMCHPRAGAGQGRLPPAVPARRRGDRSRDGGGRVTELMARPLLNLRVPELAGFVQPLAGEIAARRWLLERLSFPVGYGVEIAMLIDVLREVGLDAMGQVDLGERRNRHQPLRDLGADGVLGARRRVAAPRRAPWSPGRTCCRRAGDRRQDGARSRSGRRSQLCRRAAVLRANRVAEVRWAREAPAPGDRGDRLVRERDGSCRSRRQRSRRRRRTQLDTVVPSRSNSECR